MAKITTTLQTKAPGISKGKPPPLHEIYDVYRTARMNSKYYGAKLVTLQRWNMAIEIATLLGTSGTVASLAILKTEHGKQILGAIATVAAVLGILKPIIALSKRIERASKLYAGWNALFNSMHRLVVDIEANEQLRDELRPVYESAVDRMEQLSADDDPYPSIKLLRKLQKEVNDEIPPSTLWAPVNPDMGSASA